MDGGGAAERLWDEFRGVYEAAGSPTLASLAALGAQQRPPARVADATLSGWLTRQNVPGPQSTRVFLALVAVLQARARTHSGYEPRPEGWWQQILRQAQDERTAAQKTGRPRRQDGPAPAPGTQMRPGVRVADADLRLLGVHAAISVPGVPDEIPPEYVPRDADATEFGIRARVTAAAEHGGFVLLVGGSSVGKTRCAAEAVKALLPDWRLVHPAGPAEVAALAAVPTQTVVWLDELQRYLDSEHGLTGGLVRALLHTPQPAVIIGTLWPDLYNAYTALPEPGGADPYAREREVLNLAAVVRIHPEFSPAEQGRARDAASRDPRLRVALNTDGYGLTQTLAAAPQLVARWEDAKTASPYAWAVLTAALDAARLGVRAPLSPDFLRAAAAGYCTSRQQAEAPADWFEQAMAYAATKLHGAAAALSPAGAGMGQVAGYTVADYLLQYASRERRYARVPASTWDAVLGHVSDPADAGRLAESARRRMLNRYAETLYRRAAEAGDWVAASTLASRLSERGDLDGAVHVLRASADAGDTENQRRLTELLVQRGDLDGLRAQAGAGNRHAARRLAGLSDLDGLRARADAGDPDAAPVLAERLMVDGDIDEAAQVLNGLSDAATGPAAGKLAGLLFRRGDLDGLRARADAGDGAAADLLARMLDERGDLDGLRARARIGDRFAARRLARRLAERGDLDEAVQILRVPADAGDIFAAGQLAELLVKRGDLDGLRARADAGDRQAARQLAWELAQVGDLDGLRARAGAGDQEAARRLAWELAKRGDTDGTVQILRAWTDSGLWGVTWELSTLLIERDDLDGLSALADAGDRETASRLASLLAERGDVDGLRARADSGDWFAAKRLVDLLAGLLDEQGRSDEAGQLRQLGLNPDGPVG